MSRVDRSIRRRLHEKGAHLFSIDGNMALGAEQSFRISSTYGANDSVYTLRECATHNETTVVLRENYFAETNGTLRLRNIRAGTSIYLKPCDFRLGHKYRAVFHGAVVTTKGGHVHTVIAVTHAT